MPTTELELQGRRILLGLSGGVACYKAADLARELVKAGAEVQVVMTEGACHFITPVTMQALTGRAVYTDQWDARVANNMAHIDLTREADLILIAPASADFIAKLVQGRADDLLSLACLARPLSRDRADGRNVPLLVAPAMNREMWAHPATRRNVAQLIADGARVLGPASGDQACGETGDGRMLEATELRDELIAFFQPKLLRGKKLLITAGPTYEAIDPVRGVTNLSSGKMGFAIARAAQEAGGEVTLVAGPVALPTPPHVRRIDVTSARQMHEAVMPIAPGHDIFIATAAVADWRPTAPADAKIKKTETQRAPALTFTENPDILAEVAAAAALAEGGRPWCVGFAAESHDLVRHAREKLQRKKLALIVGNLGPATFGRDDNQLVLIDPGGELDLPAGSKLSLARQLVREIAERLAAATSSPKTP